MREYERVLYIYAQRTYALHLPIQCAVIRINVKIGYKIIFKTYQIIRNFALRQGNRCRIVQIPVKSVKTRNRKNKYKYPKP